jgi:AcrR family transcriptional regulator
MNPEEVLTRDKILSTSLALFLNKGYDNTPVQAIIDAVGIAKGTFYHHFPSKEAMLVDLVKGLSRRVVEVIAPIVADAALTAPAKLLAVSQAAVARKTSELGPEWVELVRQMRHKGNRLLADSIDEITSEWILPFFVSIVRQGSVEGAFHVTDPDWAAELVLGTVVGMKNRAFDLFLALAEGRLDALGQLQRLYAAIEQAVERILGAQAGSLPIYSSVDLKALAARIQRGGTP